jgi:hypothetical protein
MILFWLFVVCLVLGGLTWRSAGRGRAADAVRAALDGLRLFLFGKPLRAPARQPLLAPDRPVALPSRPGFLPPQVHTWPRSKPEFIVSRAPDGRSSGPTNEHG